MIFSEFQRLGPACHLIKQNTKMNYNRIKKKGLNKTVDTKKGRMDVQNGRTGGIQLS